MRDQAALALTAVISKAANDWQSVHCPYPTRFLKSSAMSRPRRKTSIFSMTSAATGGTVN